MNINAMTIINLWTTIVIRLSAYLALSHHLLSDYGVNKRCMTPFKWQSYRTVDSGGTTTVMYFVKGKRFSRERPKFLGSFIG